MVNIALYSPAMQSGKSSTAEYLIKNMGYKPAVLAYTLKRMIEVFLEDLGYGKGTVARMVYGDLKEWLIPEIGKTTRELMQTLGTEWARACIHPDVWITILAKRIKPEEKLVGEDVRFLNEAEAFRKEGFKIIRIVRPSAEVTSKHESEGGLDDYDFDCTIINDGNLEDLHTKINEMLMHYKYPPYKVEY